MLFVCQKYIFMASSFLLPFINLSILEKTVTIQAKVDLILSKQLFKLRPEEVFSEFSFYEKSDFFQSKPTKIASVKMVELTRMPTCRWFSVKVICLVPW